MSTQQKVIQSQKELTAILGTVGKNPCNDNLYVLSRRGEWVKASFMSDSVARKVASIVAGDFKNAPNISKIHDYETYEEENIEGEIVSKYRPLVIGFRDTYIDQVRIKKTNEYLLAIAPEKEITQDTGVLSNKAMRAISNLMDEEKEVIEKTEETKEIA